MIREESLTLVRRLIDAAAERDPSQLAKFYAFDAVAVSPVFGTISGRAAIAATWQTLFSTLSDVVIEVSDVLVDGDRIAVLSRITMSAATGLFGSSAGGAVR